MVVISCCWGGVMWPQSPLFVWWWCDVRCMGRKRWDGGGSLNDDDNYCCHVLSFVICFGVWCGQWFWQHSLLPHFPATIIHCPHDCCYKRHCYCQTLWHVWRVPLTCHIITTTWAGAHLVAVASDVVSWCHFVMSSAISVCYGG